MRRGARRVVGLTAALVLLVLPSAVHAEEDAGEAVEEGAEARALGARYFDDAIRHIARGQAAMPAVEDFAVRLDARVRGERSDQEGVMEIWLAGAERYRQDFTTNGVTTSRALVASDGWVRTPQGKVQRLGFNPDGRRALLQLEADRERFVAITRLLTLQSLKGPGVTFTFEGEVRPRPSSEESWLKVIRRAPGQRDMTFLFAPRRDEAGGEVRATWPGAVRIAADLEAGVPAEDYVLREWEDRPGKPERAFRYPRKIEAWTVQQRADGKRDRVRVLFAFVDDIRLNEGLSEAIFQPPGR